MKLSFPLESKLCPNCGEVFFRKANRGAEMWASQRSCSFHCARVLDNPPKNPMDVFEQMCIPEPNSGCWLWLGFITDDGYGRIAINRRIILAHRLSHELFKGPIPAGLDVLHHCDNRPCVNPDHIYAGTNDDNLDDKVRRGRQARGESHPKAKLTEDEVRIIKASPGMYKDIAAAFGVTPPQISYIKRGLTWKHVK